MVDPTPGAPSDQVPFGSRIPPTPVYSVPANVTVLLTTRDADLARRLHCQVVEIAVISEAEAVKLLSDRLGPLGQFEQEAKEVARLVGYLPLALELAAGIADTPPARRGLRSAGLCPNLEIRPRRQPASPSSSTVRTARFGGAILPR